MLFLLDSNIFFMSLLGIEPRKAIPMRDASPTSEDKHRMQKMKHLWNIWNMKFQRNVLRINNIETLKGWNVVGKVVGIQCKKTCV